MLVAVVVPNEENTTKWANKYGYKGSFLDLCTLDQLKDYILLELKATAERNKVHYSFKTRAFYDGDRFTNPGFVFCRNS